MELDENAPQNEREGGVMILAERPVLLVWVRTGGVANESVIETRVARGANILASQTMPTEAYVKMRALFLEPRLCSTAYHGLETDHGDLFGQMYAVVGLDLLRAVVGPENVPEQPEEEIWRANKRDGTQVNTMIFLGTRIRLKHRRLFPGELRAECHDHFHDILEGKEPLNVVDQLTGV
jgi:hypothetical protein